MKFFRYLILILVVQINVFGKKECDELLNSYNLDFYTKSYKGWMRVCNNDKLELYTKVKIDKNIKNEICNCFYYDYKDRDITIKDKDKR